MIEQRRNRIFHGVNRAAEFVGMPILWLFGVGMIGFGALWLVGIIAGMVAGFVAYVALRFFYEWEPHFFRILWVSRIRVRPTRNRRHHGGADYYDA